MTHTAKGRPKIVVNTKLPLTSVRPVHLIVTELAVIEPTPEGLVLKELAEGVSAQDVVSQTEAPLVLPPKIETMRLAH